MKHVIITAPNPEYCGTTAGIPFADGEADAIIEDHLEGWFESHGYVVRDITPPPIDGDAVPTPKGGKGAARR